MDIDPDALIRAGREMTDLSGRMRDDLNRLAAAVSGAPWGADEVGSAFGGAYDEVRGRVLDMLSTYVDQLVDVGAGLDEHGRALADIENINDAGVRNAGGGLR
ncbi:hypothetical protein J2S43_002286 [Catenuloplanes nepalensis]|uniref:WXG100 family type VII secretion target n=1 Tax=Catenuloplanes nepalensis TaxID=587533 RepID=A0ABT9MQV1_9ACTN|nr:hypothetical protein [Catenuloplanes nepalensis]MDP9793774.1 hypothetical protein [Catenuloplanes nepalensis]